jgi:hypothetical protein
MEVSGDTLAGVVDLFGGLTRTELGEALAELAYRQGNEYDQTAYASDIEAAVESYHLVELDADTSPLDGDDPLLLAGPLAFPTLPDNAEDLPHILDIETRDVGTDEVRTSVTEQFLSEAHEALTAGNTGRIDTLLDASYELEPWADVDLSGVRSELDDATHTS